MYSIRWCGRTLDLAQTHNGPIICVAQASKDYSQPDCDCGEQCRAIVMQGIKRPGLSGTIWQSQVSAYLDTILTRPHSQSHTITSLL